MPFFCRLYFEPPRADEPGVYRRAGVRVWCAFPKLKKQGWRCVSLTRPTLTVDTGKERA